ncbi:cbb3-type cytochrome c oxidase subunit 3 [Rhodospirillum sp. A1_3_36]|uniref:cbb3-type cytochrome c oxidase subunit 3 n=1 Tax=Rhodospirillum sp. A1_3_36 TaxID=3391666 RepID=UPI0039A74D72
MEFLTDVSHFLRQFWGLWLMLVFGGIILWAFWPKNKDRFEKYGEIPLRDDQDEER